MLLPKLIRENEIIRRYIVMSSFDGILTVLGIIIAMLVAGIRDPRLIILSTIGVIVATGISGTWGGYVAEKAERKHLHKVMEKYLMRKLDSKKLHSKREQICWTFGLANGLSNAVGSFAAIFPFFLAQFSIISHAAAFALSLGIISFSLFLLGTFVGRIAKENPYFHGIVMVLAGCIVGIIVYFFELVRVV